MWRAGRRSLKVKHAYYTNPVELCNVRSDWRADRLIFPCIVGMSAVCVDSLGDGNGLAPSKFARKIY